MAQGVAEKRASPSEGIDEAAMVVKIEEETLTGWWRGHNRFACNDNLPLVYPRFYFPQTQRGATLDPTARARAPQTTPQRDTLALQQRPGVEFIPLGNEMRTSTTIPTFLLSHLPKNVAGQCAQVRLLVGQLRLKTCACSMAMEIM